MKIKAAIFDIYDTLLKVNRPSIEEAEKLWNDLYLDFFKNEPRISFKKLCELCDAQIRQNHNESISRGIKYPEILFEEILNAVLPELTTLDKERAEDFYYRQSQVWHTVNISDAAVRVIKFLLNNGVILGIASNCQSYSIRELDLALANYGLSFKIFDADLTFLSFQHGFSKPDPYVFQILSTRLIRKKIAPEETLMIGDKLEHDLQPARLFGWKTWHLSNSEQTNENVGDWEQLYRWLLAGKQC